MAHEAASLATEPHDRSYGLEALVANRYFGYPPGTDDPWFFALSGYYFGIIDFCATRGVTWCDGRIYEHSLSVFVREDSPGTVLGLPSEPLLVSVSFKRPPWITATPQVLEKIPVYEFDQLKYYVCTVAWTVHIQPNDYGQVYVHRNWGALGTAGQNWLTLDGVQIMPYPAGVDPDDFMPLNNGSVFIASYGRPPGGYDLTEVQEPNFFFQTLPGLVHSKTTFRDPCR